MADDKRCDGSLLAGNGCGECSKCFDEAIALMWELTDADECFYDHHGKCQTHSLGDRPCEHERAWQVLKNYHKDGDAK